MSLFIFENALANQESKEALDLLNPKYTLHIVSALQDGELHFNELIRRIGITTNTLQDRLRMLIREGIVIRRVLNDMPPSVSYRLTDKGKALAEIVGRIKEWDRAWTGRHPDLSRAAVRRVATEERKPFGRRGKVS